MIILSNFFLNLYIISLLSCASQLKHCWHFVDFIKFSHFTLVISQFSKSLFYLFIWISILVYFFFFFFRENFNLWRLLLIITFYHQTKTPIGFWCRRGLNPRFLIQLSETLPIELVRTHYTSILLFKGFPYLDFSFFS